MDDREPIFSHTPVLLSECIEGLQIKPKLTYVDCTTGGGGHSFCIRMMSFRFSRISLLS